MGYTKPREIRNCFCGCGNTIECITTSKRKYIRYHTSSGKNHPMFGKHHTEQSKIKNSNSHKNVPKSQKTKDKISANQLGEKNHMYHKHHKKESCKKMSVSKLGNKCYLFGITGEKHPRYKQSPPPSSSYGVYGVRKDIGDNYSYRSTWEANFARIQNLLNIPYKYEPKRFVLIKNNGVKTTYCPDFYINGIWYEIKGYMKPDSLTKIQLFKEQYPTEILTIIDRTPYSILESKYKTLIPSWE